MRLGIGIKAQVSTEMLVAVVVVMVIAVVVGVFALNQNVESSGLFESFSSRSTCGRISSIIYSIQISDAKASVVFSIDYNASISNGFIVVKNYYCDYWGSVQDSNLSAGTFKAFKNPQGVVVFERQ